MILYFLFEVHVRIIDDILFSCGLTNNLFNVWLINRFPNQGLADAINESIRRHEQRQFELSDIHEVEAGQRNQVSVILVYEK
jgi:hypothetical protein